MLWCVFYVQLDFRFKFVTVMVELLSVTKMDLKVCQGHHQTIRQGH